MERLKKSADYFEALGMIDSLNAELGVVGELCREDNNGLVHLIERLQSTLMDIGAHIATPKLSSSIEKLKKS